MASTKFTAAFFILFVLTFSTFTSACGSCKPTPTPSKPKPTPPTAPAHCPTDALKLGVCADLLGGLVGISVGATSSKCCAVIEGLLDLEAALCLCTAIKANVLGLNLNVPVTLSLVLSACQKTVPAGFQCK